MTFQISLTRFFFTNRNTKQILIKNTFWILLAELISKLTMFVITVWIARYLGVENYGLYVFVITFTSIFSVILDFGLNTWLVREISHNHIHERKYFNTILTIKTLLSGLYSILLLLSISFINYNGETKALLILAGIFVLIQGYIVYFQSFFQAKEKMELLLITKIIYSVALLILIRYIISREMSTSSIIYSFIISAVLTLISLIILARKILSRISFSIDVKLWYKIFVSVLPFTLFVFTTAIYSRVGILFLSFYVDNKAVALYSAGYNLAILPLIISLSVGNVLYPRMSALAHTSPAKLCLLLNKTLKFTLIIILPMVVGTILTSPKIIQFIYGSQFIGSDNIMNITIWSTAFIFISSILGSYLSVLNKQPAVTRVAITCLIINIMLNIVLIPRFSLHGAAYATTITELIALSWLILYIFKKTIFHIIYLHINTLIKLIVATTLIAVCLINLNRYSLPIIMQIAIAIVGYLLVIFLLGILNKSEINALYDKNDN